MMCYQDVDTDIKEENDILPLFTDEVPSQPTSSRDWTTGMPESGLVSQNISKSDYGLCSNVDLKCFEEEYFKYIQCSSEVDDSYSDNNSDSDESPRDIFSTDENVQYLLEDVEEDMVVNGCGCEKSCHEKFVREDVLRSRLEAKSMNTRCNLGQNHSNLYVLGAINALTRRGPFTNTIHRKPKKRTRYSTKFHFQGVPVCKNFFRFVNALGTKKFKNLLKKFGAGNLNLQSSKGTSTTFQNQETTMATQQNIDAVLFLKSFAEQNALILPGRVPYHRNTDLMILPSSMNKRYVFEKYQDAAKLSDKDAVSFRTWYDLWTEFVPNIVAQKPRTDLCDKCQQNITSLGKMQCLSEQVKQSLIEKSALHINIVQAERAYYKQSIENSAETFRNHKLGQNEPCSRPGTMHYSFDFAQQVHLPHSSQQVGPLYFLNGYYKVGLFGIAVEPLNQFVLYIIPEACNTGKGSNTVISLVDHFFNNFALGETDVICHADNCCEQNKNDFLMQYAVWRTMTGKHHSFQLSFLPVGHAKFAPDLYFGLFKKKFRHSNSNSIKDLFECAVTACHNSDTITAVMVGNETGDEIHVQSYNWADYFEGQYPQTVPNLLSYNHFKASNNYPGLLQCTKSIDDDDKLNIKVFDDTMNTFREITSPTVIPPTRLTFERQQYLFQKIRPYVALEVQNVLCPKPVKRETTWDIPLVDDPLQIEDSKTKPILETAPVSCIDDYDNDLPSSSNLPSSEEIDPTSTKRKTPKCSYCGELGHRNQKRNNTYFCKKRAADEDRGAE